MLRLGESRSQSQDRLGPGNRSHSGRSAKNLGTNRKGLRDALLAVPGILAVRFDDGLIELRNVWISDPDLNAR